MRSNIAVVLGLLVTTFACDNQQASEEEMRGAALFEKLEPSASGVDFANNLNEDSVINYFTYPYIYMGGGVATGDVNNDGLPDIYFTANMDPNRLYLNKGDLKFQDITEVSGVASDDRWVTGVSMADVNADGWMDIYISVSGKFTTTKNQLFINQGLNEDGIPTFVEEAEDRSVADHRSSTQATFFDYDNDGDLDMYVANYPFTNFKTPNYSYYLSLEMKDPEKSDRLYRNDGNGYFDDVTVESGILNFGLSLSATAADFNQDGWQDIYVSNDFASPDYLFMNNGDGTFTDQLQEATQHIAFFGMGVDAGDINNDGLLDFIQMDMTPEDNYRNKANMASMNIPSFWEIIGLGMHYQYMQNALQINQGVSSDGVPHFSDIARLAGVSSTDWSWAPLLVDLDMDGWKDIFVTNGTRRDINNKDYFHDIENASYEERQKMDNVTLTLNMPSEKVDNYVFRNEKDLTFTKVMEDWGLSYEGFSNGASYADLDDDGDLEIIINNIDAPALIFENKAADQALNNFVKIKLTGPKGNAHGIGAKLWVKTADAEQYHEHQMTRGFQSSVEPNVYFGVGQASQISELKVQWLDGKVQTLKDVDVNQTLEIGYAEAADRELQGAGSNGRLFADVSDQSGLDYTHKENDFDDYRYEVLLPHRYSTNGPGLAVGDVNGDGLEDVYIGGAVASKGALFLQTPSGKFEQTSDEWNNETGAEDMGAVFFDANGDGHQDLYVVSGGNERTPGSKGYQDRLYINDGSGQLALSDGLPEITASGSRVRPGDFDGDGDLDLFVGGRIVARSYPVPARSYILRNDSQSGEAQFTDVTADVAPQLQEAGLVTDAVWTDFDNDERLDLVVVGEWMPITFLRNDGDEFSDETAALGLADQVGWWYSITAADFDNDGDEDLVAGNLGLNYKYQASMEESFDVYAYDYDKNGDLDIVLGYYNDGVQYPLRGRQCSSEQIPTIKYKYEDYNSFASATLEDIYTPQDLEASLHYQARNFASSYLENTGGSFEISNLPNEVQLSSINGMISEDFNEDGHLDLLVAGNLYGAEVETTRNDASYGQLLLGNGAGGFEAIAYSESGLFIRGDVKDLAMVQTSTGSLVVAACNNEKMKVVRVVAPSNTGNTLAASMR